mmetsp:Transcript_138875/g.258986  ORF Transcript_138875/g.258986 Transcript_138875/m.258986 type:complete len:99 (+) Transcript_138875:23-319(+)
MWSPNAAIEMHGLWSVLQVGGCKEGLRITSWLLQLLKGSKGYLACGFYQATTVLVTHSNAAKNLLYGSVIAVYIHRFGVPPQRKQVLHKLLDVDVVIL